MNKFVDFADRSCRFHLEFARRARVSIMEHLGKSRGRHVPPTSRRTMRPSRMATSIAG
jgi:hypothetical protein